MAAVLVRNGWEVHLSGFWCGRSIADVGFRPFSTTMIQLMTPSATNHCEKSQSSFGFGTSPVAPPGEGPVSIHSEIFAS